MKINSVLQFFQVFQVSKIVHPFLQVFTRSDHKRYFPRWNVEETGAGYFWDMYIVRFATFDSLVEVYLLNLDIMS